MSTTVQADEKWQNHDLQQYARGIKVVVDDIICFRCRGMSAILV